MTKVYASDLVQANNSRMISVLETIKGDISHLIGDINNFSTGSVNELIGSGYDAVRAKLGLYVDCFNKLSAICSNLIPCIQAANNTLLNFMEGYSELDDSKIPEVEAAIAEAEAYLAWLLDTHDEPGPDENGDGFPDYTVKVRNGTDAEISACEATIRELKHYLEKLKLLAPTDKSAFAAIQAVMADIGAFASAVSGLRIPNYDGTFPQEGSAFAKELAYTLPNGEKQYFSFYQYAQEWQNSGWRSKDGEPMTSGCSVCALAACLATIYQNPEINPHTLGLMWRQHNDNLKPGEVWWTNRGVGYVSEIAGGVYGLDVDENFNGNKEKLDNILRNNGTVLVAGGQTGGAVGGHFFSIIGYDEKTGKYIVADSSPAVFHNPDNADHTLLTVSYDELFSVRHVARWVVIAPPGMTVEEAKQAKTERV